MLLILILKLLCSDWFWFQINWNIILLDTDRLIAGGVDSKSTIRSGKNIASFEPKACEQDFILFTDVWTKFLDFIMG